MREPLRSGGTVTVYQIEGQFPRTKSTSEAFRGKWCTRHISASHFGEKMTYHSNWDKDCPIFKEYGANGKCWQLTGLDGFLDEDLAYKAFDRLVKHAPHDPYIAHWRLIRREIAVFVGILSIHPAKRRKKK